MKHNTTVSTVPSNLKKELDAYLKSKLPYLACKDIAFSNYTLPCPPTYSILLCFNNVVPFETALHVANIQSVGFRDLKDAMLRDLVGATERFAEYTHPLWSDTIILLWSLVKPAFSQFERILQRFLIKPPVSQHEYVKACFYHSLITTQIENPTKERDLILLRLAKTPTHTTYVTYGEHRMKYFAVMDAMGDIYLTERKAFLYMLTETNIAYNVSMLTHYYLFHPKPSFRNLLFNLYPTQISLRMSIFKQHLTPDLAHLLLYRFVMTLIK